jgi:hypothetical protein
LLALEIGTASLAALARFIGDIMTDGHESSEEQSSQKPQGDEKPQQSSPPPSGQSENSQSLQEPSSGNGEQKQMSAGQLKKKIAGEFRRNQAREAAIQREFKDWKKTLINMIRSQSRIVRANDGTVTFLLPPRLVKLVWNTTIKERAAYAAAKGSKNPMRDGLEGLRTEITDAVTRIDTATEEQEKQKQQRDADEEAAAKALAEEREKLVKQMDGQDDGESERARANTADAERCN